MKPGQWLVALFLILTAGGGGFLAGRGGTAAPPAGSAPAPARRDAPLIGIASVANDACVRAIREAGGIPVVLPDTGGDTGQIEDYLARLDGLLLPGGADIPPAEYGEEPHASVQPLEEDRFRFEKALSRAWIERTDKPLLGICLGSQWLNVASGGSLVQDLPAERHTNHRNTTHPVTLEADSRLARILGATVVEANSFHHQASDTIGRGLRAVARSPDGIVEAIETTDARRFLIGVQWHPEKMAPGDAAQAKLLKAFVAAAAAVAD